MFTPEQKRRIAEVVEIVLMEVNNPEMPKEKPKFNLFVDGKDPDNSWADIIPNWEHEENNKR